MGLEVRVDISKRGTDSRGEGADLQVQTGTLAPLPHVVGLKVAQVCHTSGSSIPAASSISMEAATELSSSS